MKPAPFEYHRPRTLDEAVELMATLDNPKVLSGGQSLVPMMNFRYVMPDHIVDISGIAEISGNDFEAPTFERYPGLREARNALLDAGAIVAHLSGSGSALFGVFPDVEARDAAVALLRDRAPELRTIPTKTL